LEHLAALTAGAVREWFQSSWPLEQAFRLQSLAKALYRGELFPDRRLETTTTR
jgi:hypothetical protein